MSSTRDLMQAGRPRAHRRPVAWALTGVTAAAAVLLVVVPAGPVAAATVVEEGSGRTESSSAAIMRSRRPGARLLAIIAQARRERVDTAPAVPTPTAQPTVPPVVVQPSAPLRAFSSGSPWNRLLPASAPVHPDSSRILANIKANNVNNGCVMLSGTGTNTWGTPVYWASSGDPSYTVRRTRYDLPPEFASLRIPRGAKPMAAADGEMTIFDRERGYVAWLSRAVYDATNDQWSAGGGSIAYLSSNGVVGSLPGSDERRNTGSHRGLNGAIVAARYDEVQAGGIDHALRIGVRGASTGFVWPMTGSDGKSTDPYAPKQGSRLRIKPSIDLSRYRLAPDALVLARALQRYGAVVGDSTGAPVELKLEDTVQQGRGQLWRLPQNALCAVPIEAFEVLSESYR
jgi:hypothetical protein